VSCETCRTRGKGRRNNQTIERSLRLGVQVSSLFLPDINGNIDETLVIRLVGGGQDQRWICGCILNRKPMSDFLFTVTDKKRTRGLYTPMAGIRMNALEWHTQTEATQIGLTLKVTRVRDDSCASSLEVIERVGHGWNLQVIGECTVGKHRLSTTHCLGTMLRHHPTIPTIRENTCALVCPRSDFYFR
jgi:hypothetical protein